MPENRIIPAHIDHRFYDTAWAAENKSIDPVQVRTDFPKGEKQEESQKPADRYQMVMASVGFDKFLLTRGNIIHRNSTPSISH